VALVNAAFVSLPRIYNPFLAFHDNGPCQARPTARQSGGSNNKLSSSCGQSLMQNVVPSTSWWARTHIVVQASESRQELTQIAFGVRSSTAQDLQKTISYIFAALNSRISSS